MRTSMQLLGTTGLVSTGTTGPAGMSDEIREVTAYIVVSGMSGIGATVTFTLQVSPDGVNWFDAVSSLGITAIGSTRLALTGNVAPFVRVSYVIAGATPNATTMIYLDARG